ncbi:rhodanese domain-containing protein CG4456-like [Athalia rosae]|uniref:rhodanese domain-containing protein CG4456-like n=1 Tax=Athalia rosae TaxID=37344 RepID=UPI002033C925|nr:rhodanese domain-containing protein CG4456-like [Athalia rosae]XP_048512939.1 rhodanese domain-containing protein CG4456-like [Athalia rosae]
MFYSRIITKHLKNIALLRPSQLIKADNRRHLLHTSIATKHMFKTCQSTSIVGSKYFRHLSTSNNLLTQSKVMAGEGDNGLNLGYEDLIKAQKDESVLIVDVREDEEIKETGKLPGSIHIPMGQVEDIFKNYSEEAFLRNYQVPKPTKDTKIIFSCRSGKRSAMVQDAILKLGYPKSYNYTGGWLDWESRQEKAQK